MEEQNDGPAIPDLSITLYDLEREELARRGETPEGFVAIDFPIAALQVHSAGPKGAIFIAQFVVPNGHFEFLEQKNILFGPNGQAMPPNMTEHVGLPLALRIVFRKEAFTEKAKADLGKSLLLQQQAHQARASMLKQMLESSPVATDDPTT